MFLAINNNIIDTNQLIISEKKKNNVITDSFFYRIYYSDNSFISNGIVLSYCFEMSNIEKFFKKIKFIFKDKNNIQNIENIICIENKLLNYFNNKKKKKFSLRDQLKQNFIKIQNNNYTSFNLNKLNVVLKISGFWETKFEIGLTYRFFICD